MLWENVNVIFWEYIHLTWNKDLIISLKNESGQLKES